jgi:transcriptional regulator with XRE-family HTH domain
MQMQPEDLNKLVGLNIRRRRQELRLTQQQLAERMEIWQPYLSEIENGKRATTLATLAEIAEALEVTPSYLLAGQPLAPI